MKYNSKSLQNKFVAVGKQMSYDYTRKIIRTVSLCVFNKTTEPVDPIRYDYYSTVNRRDTLINSHFINVFLFFMRRSMSNGQRQVYRIIKCGETRH